MKTSWILILSFTITTALSGNEGIDELRNPANKCDAASKLFSPNSRKAKLLSRSIELLHDRQRLLALPKEKHKLFLDCERGHFECLRACEPLSEADRISDCCATCSLSILPGCITIVDASAP